MNRARVTMGLLLSIVVLSATVFLILPNHSYAAAGINSELSFEGKIVTSAGINVPDGTYNMEFKIYSGGTATGGGTLEWTEDYLVGGSGQAGVSFSSGTFQVNLGTNCPFTTSTCETYYNNTAVNWDSNPLYLSMQIGNTSSCTLTSSSSFGSNCGGTSFGGGEMSPYILLTSTPYSFNSNELGGITAAGFGQLATAQTWTNSNTFEDSTNSTSAFLVDNNGAVPLIDADTINNSVGINNASTTAGYALNVGGNIGTSGTISVEDSAYTNNAVLINDGQTLSASLPK